MKRLCILIGIAAPMPVNSLASSAGREATPAVVNPAIRSPWRETISLDGTWDFAIDPKNVGEERKWQLPATALPGKMSIEVPGCWEAQGVAAPGDSRSVTPEQSIRPLIGCYVGAAWYKKQVNIPPSFSGKRIWLKIGGVNAQGWFYVNGVYVGHLACYCGTYKYDITDLVRPGEKAVVAVKVRNDVPSGKGLMNWIHRFGGLYRMPRSTPLPPWPSMTFTCRAMSTGSGQRYTWACELADRRPPMFDRGKLPSRFRH